MRKKRRFRTYFDDRLDGIETRTRGQLTDVLLELHEIREDLADIRLELAVRPDTNRQETNR